MSLVSNDAYGAAYISVIGGGLISWLLTKYGKQVAIRTRVRRPDRIEQVFNGYEKFIAQLQKENEHKDRLLRKMERHADYLETVTRRLRESVVDTRAQLDDANDRLEKVTANLQTIKQRYKM